MTEHQNETTHTVRPRWTWMALLVMLAGLALIAWGIIGQSWTMAAPGIAALAIGGLMGLYGGLFYDVQGGASPKAQFQDIREGNEHEFPGAGTKRSEAEVKRDVRERWLSDGE
jgi:hypothetical protein